MNSKSVLRIILRILSFRTYLFFLLLFLSFYNSISHAQWTQTNGPKVGLFVFSLAVSPNGAGGTNLFAGTYYNGIFLSTNNGDNWIDLNSGLTNTIVNSLAISGENIYAGTFQGVYLSSDIGKTWTPINNGLLNTYVNAIAVDGNNIFAGTQDGVYLSTNNGSSWKEICKVNSYALSASGTNIFVGLGNNCIYTSTNNGTDWTSSSLGLTFTIGIYSLAVSGTNIFAGTNGAGLYLSTDNAKSWKAINSGLTGSNIYAFAINGMNIFAGGDGILISTNNGTNWTDASLGFANPHVWALAISGEYIFAGASGSGVWRRPLSELTGVSNELNNTPKDFALSQNYPNPFNPSTVISYSIPSAANVKVIVYNAVGQKVEIIKNGFKQAGNYSVSFNASDLPSGIYFYRLEAGQFSQVKKMLLLK